MFFRRLPLTDEGRGPALSRWEAWIRLNDRYWPNEGTEGHAASTRKQPPAQLLYSTDITIAILRTSHPPP